MLRLLLWRVGSVCRLGWSWRYPPPGCVWESVVVGCRTAMLLLVFRVRLKANNASSGYLPLIISGEAGGREQG